LDRVHLGSPTSRAALLVAVVLTTWVLLRHLRAAPAVAVAATVAAWTLGLPYLLAGYLGWCLPTVALARRVRVAAVVAAESVALLVGYAVVRNPVHGILAPLASALVVLMPLTAAVGLVVLLLDRTPRARDGGTVRSEAGALLHPRALVVVPTYEEVATVEPLLRRLRAAAPDADVLVIDDGSPDGTAARVAHVASDLGGIELLERLGPLGLGSAYRTGFAWGMDRGYDVVCEMDADLSHEPEALPGLLEAIAAGADVAIGSRYVAGGRCVDWSWHRRALSRLGGSYARLGLGLRVHDPTSGFRAYRAQLLQQLDLGSVAARGFGFQIEMTHRAAQAGARIVEVPIVFRERSAGRSKMSGAIVAEGLALVTRLALDRGAGAPPAERVAAGGR
jgi:hypothetical protein